MSLLPWEQKEDDLGSFFCGQCLHIYNQEGLIGFRSPVSFHLLLMASRDAALQRILSHIQVQQGKVLWLISDTCHKYQRRWRWQRRQELAISMAGVSPCENNNQASDISLSPLTGYSLETPMSFPLKSRQGFFLVTDDSNCLAHVFQTPLKLDTPRCEDVCRSGTRHFRSGDTNPTRRCWRQNMECDHVKDSK